MRRLIALLALLFLCMPAWAGDPFTLPAWQRYSLIDANANPITGANPFPVTIIGGGGGSVTQGTTPWAINGTVVVSNFPSVQAINPNTCTLAATYPSGTSGTLIAANSSRKSLRWMNIGTVDVTIAPGTTPPTVGQGMIYQAQAAGKQGASETFADAAVAGNAFAFAAASSANLVVWECQ